MDGEDTDPVSWPDEQAISQQIMHSQVPLRCVLISMSPDGSSLTSRLEMLTGRASSQSDGLLFSPACFRHSHWSSRILSFSGYRECCHSVDRGNFVIRWLEGILSFGGYREFCHSMDRGDFVIRWIEGILSFCGQRFFIIRWIQGILSFGGKRRF